MNIKNDYSPNTYMGVPAYFAWWVKNYALRILHRAPPALIRGQKRVLYLDFNGIIHPAIREDPTLQYRNMPAAVCQYLYDIVKAVAPNEIYIAIDGVAPFAKMDQQRDRRYKASKESKIKREIAMKHKAPTSSSRVDFNMISPGTEFMRDLHMALQAFIVERKADEWRDIPITLDGCNRPGEGEHKIMQEIRRRAGSGFGGSSGLSSREQTCICGLDADLMFLSLLNVPDALLVRENVHFQGRDRLDLDPEEYPYVYLNIAALKDIMINTLKPQTDLEGLRSMGFENKVLPLHMDNPSEHQTDYYDDSPAHRQRLITDYAYICFFLGNDFLPRLPALRIHDGALSDLVVFYKRIAWRLGRYLISIGPGADGADVISVDPEFIYLFLDELAHVENELLLKQNDNRFRDISKFRYRLAGKSPYEAELEEFNYIENKYDDVIEAGEPGWRKRYYNYHMGWVYQSAEQFDALLTPVCRNYMAGTCWVLGYYLGLHQNWNWIYDYPMAPSAQDFIHLFGSYDRELSATFRKTIPVSPFVQLLSILPPDSAALLPVHLRKLMTDRESPIHYMYPLRISLSLVGNKFWYQCKARLPPVDQAALSIIVGAKEDSLTEEERHRNRVHPVELF